MSKEDDVVVYLYERGISTDSARLFSRLPNEKCLSHKAMAEAKIWLPRSQILHLSKAPHTVGEWPECAVTIPYWLANKLKLL